MTMFHRTRTTIPVRRRRRGVAAALRRLIRARRGSVVTEFAMAMPIIIMITLGGVELARYTLLQQKLARTTVTMADLVTQAEELSENDINQLMAAVEPVMEPFSMVDSGIVIVSSVAATGGNPPTVVWQRTGGGGLTGATSAIGTEGGTATLPSGFIVRDGENAVIAETFFDFSPLFTAGLIHTGMVYHRAMFRPRFGALDQISP